MGEEEGDCDKTSGDNGDGFHHCRALGILSFDISARSIH